MDIVAEIYCRKCENWKAPDEFYTHGGKKGSPCKSCEKSTMNSYHSTNRDKNLSDMALYRRQARVDAIRHYGGSCVCCGEETIEFLAIDHMNGGGRKHQKEINGMAIGIWLRKNKYPAGFRVLCHNCNQALGHYGYCPHKIQNSAVEF